MNFEDLQKTWQSQDAFVKATINADLVLQEVRRNQRQFGATIFWRDVREVGVAFLMTACFIYVAVKTHQWGAGATALACFWVGVFMLVDRRLQHRQRPDANASLRACIEISLLQVNHQIRLLKTIFWWYLLPLATGVVVWIINLAWGIPLEGRLSRVELAGLLLGSSVIICGLTFWLVFWLNQFAVRNDLEPRRKELETLLASLK
jgi:hypothetical protein